MKRWPKGLRERVLEEVRVKRRERRIRLMLLVVFVVALALEFYGGWRSLRETSTVEASVPITAVTVKPVEQEKDNEWHYEAGADGLPEKLYIRGERWTLQQVKDFTPDTGTLAMTDCTNRTIFYKSITTPANLLREDISHELFHAYACDKGNSDYYNSASDLTHEGVYHAGEVMASFLRENPEMAAWFAHGQKEAFHGELHVEH